MQISTSFIALTAAAAAISVAPQAVYSQGLGGEFYAGGFLGSAAVDTVINFDTGGFFDNYSDNASNIGAIAGWRIHRNAIFYGVEVDISLPLEDGFNAIGGLDYDAHIRGIVGYELDSVNLFAGLGIAMIGTGTDSAAPSTTLNGYSIGVGVEYKLNDRITLRLEDVYDDFGEVDIGGGYVSEWAQNTIRVAAIFTF